MAKNIRIRADGSSEIGLGHLVRCLALAEMLKNRFSVTFNCKYIPESIASDIQESGFSLKRIQTEEEWLEILSEDDVVVLDHYDFDTAFQARIKGKGSKLVCIDDLHDKKFIADIIINHSPGVLPEDYEAEPYTSFALGPAFSLLRPRFIEASRQDKKQKDIDSIMICFGGSDIKNLTEKVLKVVLDFTEFGSINVVLGAAYLYRTTITSIAEKEPRLHLMESLDEQGMISVIQSSDLSIIPASGILLETIAGGSLPLICYYADNQKELFHYFQSSELLPSFNAIDFDQEELHRGILQLLNTKGGFGELPFRKEIQSAGENHRRVFSQFLEN